MTEISPRHQREVFSPHPDDPYLSVEIGLYYLISRFRKQVGVLLRLRRDDLKRRLCATDRRKALRRCPDLSRKRDGIVVRALSFLPSPLLEANRVSRSAPLDREMRRRAKLGGKPRRPKVERTSRKAAK